jgi:hypothetical protein
MDDPVSVAMRNCTEQVVNNATNDFLGEHLSVIEIGHFVEQLASFTVLHDDVEVVGVVICFEVTDDVRVVHRLHRCDLVIDLSLDIRRVAVFVYILDGCPHLVVMLINCLVHFTCETHSNRFLLHGPIQVKFVRTLHHLDLWLPFNFVFVEQECLVSGVGVEPCLATAVQVNATHSRHTRVFRDSQFCGSRLFNDTRTSPHSIRIRKQNYY